MSAYYIGLMTGTSVDAIDAAILRFDRLTQKTNLIASLSSPLSDTLRADIIALFTPNSNEIDRLGEIDIELAHAYAQTIKSLLKKAKLKSTDITAIGSHGQTIRHRPQGCEKKQPFTLQIGDPNTLAALTNITVVADFRRKDIALNGQGAPLAPAYHHHILREHAQNCVVLNIGGIANITLIKQDSLSGFDTGPGNALLDYWFMQHNHGHFDQDGEWARSGKLIPKLLTALLTHPYFAKQPPKSTGKEEFTAQWLISVLSAHSTIAAKPEDIQRTLTEFTARSIATEIQRINKLEQIYVCGGGLKNLFLIECLRAQLPQHKLESTKEIGFDPEWIEASAFAWLAKQTMDGLPGNQPKVTGASRAAILGGIYLP